MNVPHSNYFIQYMSADNKNTKVDTTSSYSCASCGIVNNDDVKLKNCTACYLVKYCSIKCQKEHRPKHKRACKKRVAELRDELLFKQPESSHKGDCPICFVPLPLDNKLTTIMTCCSKTVCDGCFYANVMREVEAKIKGKCPFCREANPQSQEESDNRTMKRIQMNDPVAMTRQGMEHFENGDYSGAIEYWNKSAELGDVDGHYKLSNIYTAGLGVEKDKGKMLYHLEEAAIGGHPTARYNLGCWELNDGNIERGVKHFIIAASQGFGSTKVLMEQFKRGSISKEVLAAALRAHQVAVDATKSPQRERAKERCG